MGIPGSLRQIFPINQARPGNGLHLLDPAGDLFGQRAASQTDAACGAIEADVLMDAEMAPGRAKEWINGINQLRPIS